MKNLVGLIRLFTLAIIVSLCSMRAGADVWGDCSDIAKKLSAYSGVNRLRPGESSDLFLLVDVSTKSADGNTPYNRATNIMQRLQSIGGLKVSRATPSAADEKNELAPLFVTGPKEALIQALDQKFVKEARLVRDEVPRKNSQGRNPVGYIDDGRDPIADPNDQHLPLELKPIFDPEVLEVLNPPLNKYDSNQLYRVNLEYSFTGSPYRSTNVKTAEILRILQKRGVKSATVSSEGLNRVRIRVVGTSAQIALSIKDAYHQVRSAKIESVKKARGFKVI